MADKLFTIILISDRSTQNKKLVFTYRQLRWGAMALAFFILLFLFLVFGFFREQRLHRHNVALRAENDEYHQEIEKIRIKVATIDTYLERVKRFDKKLRLITNLQDSDPTNPSAHETNLAGFDVPDFSIDPDLGKTREKLDTLHTDLEKIEKEGSQRESSLQDLEGRLSSLGSLLRSTPAIWPSQGWVTSSFGFRINPFSGTRMMHDGLDIAARPGTPVIAPADGMVTFVGEMGSFGKMVVVNHGYGKITRYGHLMDSFVKLGDAIKRGQKIASVGNTGRSTGPHLHYEVLVNGIPHDPKRFILD